MCQGIKITNDINHRERGSTHSSRQREGVIIEWPLNGLFHERRDVIMTFWTDVLGVDHDTNDNELSIFTLKRRYK